MPLEEKLPAIDNRTYDDIMSELRKRIPQYTPEWTDQNDSDPGITIAQLFAWLTEMILFRLGQVPQLNYIKFLQLLGMDLRPAEPAKAEITFSVREKYPEATVEVPAQTQISAESNDGSGDIVFETERELNVLAAELKEVWGVVDGNNSNPYTVINEEMRQGFYPFGNNADPGSALMFGFQGGRPFPVETNFDLAILLSEEIKESKSINCIISTAQRYASSEIIWEYWNNRHQWTPLTLLKDETFAFTISGYVHLKSPGKGKIQKTTLGLTENEHYWIRARLKESQYENTPKILTIRTNTVPALQAESVVDEIVGGSDGSPNQSFRLENKPVLSNTLVLEVDEGDGVGFIEWERKDDFFGSTPKSKHYTLNRTTGEIRFGDGVNGAVPIANIDNIVANVVAKRYRFGGGERGNVDAHKINEPLNSIPDIDDNKIMNLRAAHSGRSEETIEQAKKRVPESIKSKCRAVTESDFEELARQAANIRRAKALPLHHPDFPDVPVPGVISVIVIPDSKNEKPMPNEGTIRTVCEYLNDRRLLTTELFVLPPKYKEVSVKGSVVVHNDADIGDVKEKILKKLLSYFHPLNGGEDGLGWPFGRDVYASLVYQLIFKVPGVKRIDNNELSIFLDGEKYGACQDAPIPDDVLVYSTTHDVKVTYDYDE